MGFFYSAAHTVLPFLLLGIGIDDMFVIVQSLNTLPTATQVGSSTKRQKKYFLGKSAHLVNQKCEFISPREFVTLLE